jgi:class 3 adenylate cyclase
VRLGGVVAISRGDEAPSPSTALAPLEALLARHAPTSAQAVLDATARRDLATAGSTAVHAVVVVGDLRLSGLVLREAVSPSLYARFVVGFTEAVRSLSASYGGWFDKFTGDGFVAFWLYPAQGSPPAAVVPEFCQSVLPASERLVANLRRNSRNFPVGVGLALGLDSGPCELVRIGEALTLVGSPIVGASRMAAGARAGEAIVNVHLGDLLEREHERGAETGLAVERAVVRTKEYPEGQEAYRLSFSRTPAARDDGRPD